MSSKIVLFGATGYTGHLVAEALADRMLAPILCGRNKEKLERLSRQLGNLETAVTDAKNGSVLAGLLSKGDILISTVGPFVKYGRAAIAAAVDKGAVYIDSTGEPAFIQTVFEHYGPRAQATGATLLTACGYDYVPGNCAAALALDASGPSAARVDIGYYVKKHGMIGSFEASQGTRASLAIALVAPVKVWRSGQRVAEAGGIRVRRFCVDGIDHPALSVSGTEHFCLPRIYPGLQNINTYLGWFGPKTGIMKNAAVMQSVLLKVPGYRFLAEGLLKLVSTSRGKGPDALQRKTQASHIIAETFNPSGERLFRVDMTGVDAYTFTARFMAWAAHRLHAGGICRPGALGPIDLFGVEQLRAGCEQSGLTANKVEGPAAYRASLVVP
jgi:short subunit dehydrogenase-like uncharacterized protein